jgi:hypothetical protein
MALSRPLRFSACWTALLAFSAAGAVAAETETAPDLVTFNEVRIGYYGAPTPTIHEKDGDTWSGGDARGWKIGLTWLRVTVPDEGNLATAWGAQVSIANHNVGKDSASVVPLTQGMADFYYGGRYGIFDSESLHGFAELMPFVGVGLNNVEVDTQTRVGPQFEAGLKTGAFLTEHDWLAGLALTYTVGQGRAASPYTTIDVRQNGFTFGFEVGRRF